MAITHAIMKDYEFLAGMYADTYYPRNLVDQGRDILMRLCEQIEAQAPADEDALYDLTQAAAEEFNALQEAFNEAGSDLETVARECIAEDFGAIMDAYGFEDADLEEAIASRDW